MKKGWIVLLMITMLVACQPEGRIYEKHKALSPNLEWLKKDVRQFEVPVHDVNQAYDLSLSFRYANGYQFNVVKVKMTETSPSGKASVQQLELKVREDNGDYIGQPGYDIWDSEHLIAAGKSFEEQGTYTYTLEHDMPVDPLNFAMEIGLVLDKE